MESSIHKHRNCLNLEDLEIGTKRGPIEGNVIDDEAKTILQLCPEANFMVAEIENHLIERYSKVFKRTLDRIESFPQVYNYGVDTKNSRKAFAMQYGDESKIEARIQQLKASKKMEDVKERTHLEDILKQKRPLACEEKVNRRFLSFFKDEPGLFLHGFKPKEYLQRFRELAKEIRKSMTSLRLLDIELCLLQLLSIEKDEIENWVNDKMSSIKTRTIQEYGISSIPGTLLWDVLKLGSSNSFEKGRKNQYNQLKSLFPKFEKSVQKGKLVDLVDENGDRLEKMYTKNEIRARLLESEFDFQTTFDDEYDLFLFLPNHRLILAGEVKQAMKNDANAKFANDKQAKSASHQLKKSEKYVRKSFGNLLDHGWRYVKIAILYDNHGTYVTEKCPDCSPFILTNGTEKEEMQQMQELWKAIEGKEYNGPPKQKDVSGTKDFRHIFARLIGFSGLSFIVQNIGEYHELMGTNPHEIFDSGITAGWTKASPLTFGNEKEEVRFGDVIGRPADIYRLIFWNPDQRDLLCGAYRFVIFCHDYGAGKLIFYNRMEKTLSIIKMAKFRDILYTYLLIQGKSLLLKEGSIKEVSILQPNTKMANHDEEFNDQPKEPYAYFICLVATSNKGFPEKEMYLYDIATEMELDRFRVEFLSTDDLKKFYKKYHPDYDENEVNVYAMAYFFIKMHRGSSFFFDEVPFIQPKKVKYDTSSIERLQTFLLDCQKEIFVGKLWVALQANVLSDQYAISKDFEKRYHQMVSELEKFFWFPKLSKNMRNSGNINKASKDLKGHELNYGQVSKIIKPLPPPHAAESLTTFTSKEEPILIPIHQNDFESCFKDILEPILDLTKKTLMLHSQKFDGKALKSFLLSNFPNVKDETVIQHDTYPNNATKIELQNFLRHSETRIGIFQTKFVTGIEGSHVIYFHDAGKAINTSVRCTMTRAVTNLCIVLQFNSNTDLFTQFNSMKIKRTFIRCQKTLKNFKEEKWHKWQKFKCETCKINQICKACAIGCHHGHEAKFEASANTGAETCSCSSLSCLIQHDKL